MKKIEKHLQKKYINVVAAPCLYTIVLKDAAALIPVKCDASPLWHWVLNTVAV
jgi:hypothetical protein